MGSGVLWGWRFWIVSRNRFLGVLGLGVGKKKRKWIVGISTWFVNIFIFY